jgi:alpha-L-rhamnosidase
VRVIADHYDGMKAWIEHMRQYIKDGILDRDSYGDWCVPPENPVLIHSKDPKRITSGAVIGTSYFFHDLELMERYARLIGKPDDAEAFRALADTMKPAFNERFFNEDSHDYDNGSQTASVLPLAFGIVPEDQRDAVFNTLVDKITVGTNGHIGTGLIGGQWLMRTLSDGGRPDIAFTLATHITYPSWGYMVEHGATTFWELWNGNTADPAMNSHNHVMLIGDLVTWFYGYLAGIRADYRTPGYKVFTLQPEPVAGLNHVRATHNSLYGTIVSDWTRDGDMFTWSVTVPPNTTATVHIPTSDSESVTEGGVRLSKADGIRNVHTSGVAIVCTVGGGTYVFNSKLK